MTKLREFPSKKPIRRLKRGFVVISILTFLYLTLNPSFALNIISVRKTVVQQVDAAWQKLKAFNTSGKSADAILKTLGDNVRAIPMEIAKVEKELQVYEYLEALKLLGTVKNTSTTWLRKWDTIQTLSTPVDILYGYFKLFPETPQAFIPNSTDLEFDAIYLSKLILEPLLITGNSSISDNSTLTLSKLLETIHETTKGRENVFIVLSHQIEDALEQNHWCLWNYKTPQRLIYGLYVSLGLLQLKGYVLNNFGHMINYMLNDSDPENASTNANTTLQHQFIDLSTQAKKLLEKSSSALWKCDPNKFEKGKTYEEFQELLQGYIENEKYLHHTGSCKQNCEDFGIVKAYCPTKDEACRQQRMCTGSLMECQYVTADSMVCPADAPRRYDYIQYKKGPTFGDNSGRCSKELIKRDSFWRLLFHCTNCLCLCDDPNSPTTIRHLSLLSSSSDTYVNKIVTGVRFVMINGVLHLQVQQGEAAPEGGVLEETTNWKTLSAVSKKNKSQVITLDYNTRAFDLDDLLVPKNYVLTGVRFRLLGNHINLEIQGTQINSTTGKLMEHSVWLGNDNTPGKKQPTLDSEEEEDVAPREQLILDDPDIPTKNLGPNLIDSVHDQYIMFQASSRVKDVAQTTVPFIDIQEVRPKPAVWLKGVGIYHRGRMGYGGFIAPRVFTQNVADFIPIDHHKQTHKPS